MTTSNIEIDEQKVKRMASAIVKLEQKNTKTKQYTKSALINEIYKIIEAEVNMDY